MTTKTVFSLEYTPQIEILKTLNDCGFEAYFVGGFVRDTLLGRQSKDVDIATAATPVQIADVFPDTELIGAHFGVSLVKHAGVAIEVATFRLDGAYSDSRHPDSVAFTYNLQEDLRRRDFTINALVMDATGQVYDYVGGEPDLAAREIHTVGVPSERFQEDALRMLRAIRFACQLGFAIGERTLIGIIENAHLIRRVSSERIAQELNRILTSGRVAEGIELLRRTGLLRIILPEIQQLCGVEQNPKYHPEGDVYVHTLGLLRQLEPGCSLTLALAALFHDVGKPATAVLKNGHNTFHGHEDFGAAMTRNILNRLKYSGEIVDTVVSHVEQHMKFMDIKILRKGKLLRFVRQENFAELVALHRLDAGSGLGNMDHAEFAEATLAEVPPEKLRPTPLITGRDLIEFGFKPGPVFKPILEFLETEQLEGRLVDRESALRILKAWACGLPPSGFQLDIV